tara:strand:+ start:963 stop:1712 length:750 start_codon:yes stop_codon:yes gene_type:complete
MKLTANNKTIDFFEFDDSQFDRVFLALSGGTDSAMLLYLTCIEKPDWKIVCHTGIDKHKDPWVGEYAAEIVDFMQKRFPHVDIVHEQYKFNSLDPIWLYRAEKDWNAHPNKETLPTIQGHAKAVAAKPHKHELRKKYDIKLSMHGITANPPIEVQEKLGFIDVAEPRRNLVYDEFDWKKSGNLHYTPFINVDKRFVAELYKQYDLLDDLFPLTRSCIGFEKETDYFTRPCEECFWCHEKMWAFGTYDPV